MSVKGPALDLRDSDKVRGVQVSALSLPRAACRQTSPTPARCQPLQECHCETCVRYGKSILQVDHRHRQTHANVRCTGHASQRKMYHMEGLVGNLHGTEASDVLAPAGVDDALEPEHLHGENGGSGDDEQWSQRYQ